MDGNEGDKWIDLRLAGEKGGGGSAREKGDIGGAGEGGSGSGGADLRTPHRRVRKFWFVLWKQHCDWRVENEWKNLVVQGHMGPGHIASLKLN